MVQIEKITFLYHLKSWVWRLFTSLLFSVKESLTRLDFFDSARITTKTELDLDWLCS